MPQRGRARTCGESRSSACFDEGLPEWFRGPQGWDEAKYCVGRSATHENRAWACLPAVRRSWCDTIRSPML